VEKKLEHIKVSTFQKKERRGKLVVCSFTYEKSHKCQKSVPTM
jgi:Pyocin activator protein PrtN.